MLSGNWKQSKWSFNVHTIIFSLCPNVCIYTVKFQIKIIDYILFIKIYITLKYKKLADIHTDSRILDGQLDSSMVNQKSIWTPGQYDPRHRKTRTSGEVSETTTKDIITVKFIELKSACTNILDTWSTS